MRKRTTTLFVVSAVVVTGALWASDAARANGNEAHLSEQVRTITAERQAAVMEGDDLAAQVMEQQAQIEEQQRKIEALTGEVEGQKKRATRWAGKYETAKQEQALAEDQRDESERQVRVMEQRVEEAQPEMWNGFTVGEVIVCPEGWAVSEDTTATGQVWAACM